MNEKQAVAQVILAFIGIMAVSCPFLPEKWALTIRTLGVLAILPGALARVTTALFG